MANWSFLTNHGRTLVCIAQDPSMRLRDIAAALAITERSAYAVVADLVEAGYIVKDKEGRRNRYQIQRHMAMPEPPGGELTIGHVLDILVGTGSSPDRRRGRA